MSSIHLLDKTRKIGKLLNNNSSSKVVFNDICTVMSDIMESNVMVLSKKGKLLGLAKSVKVAKMHGLPVKEVGKFIDGELNERLLSVLSTKENVNLLTLGIEKKQDSVFHALIAPINIAGERLGTLFLYNNAKEYDIDDIILCEYGTTVVGLEMMRSLNEEYEEDHRRDHSAHSAMDALSLSEKKAIGYVFSQLEDGEGLVVASKIADEVKITRSVIVNALRKLESAGIIITHSAGMKGTYIKIVNEVIYKLVEEEAF